MKYRIIEKTKVLKYTDRVSTVQTFTPQRKYPFWPFWIDIHKWGLVWELEEAQREIEAYIERRIKYPPIIHEYPIKNLDKAKEHANMYP